MSNADIFIEKYKQLEAVVRKVYHLSDGDVISKYLTENTPYKRYENDIKYCQKVRNFYQHNNKIQDNFAVEPNACMLDFIDNLIEQIENRKKCSDIAITLKNICYKSLSDKVKPVMALMRINLYTHIPILENGIVIGVFDENSIFDYLSDEEIVAIEDDLTFADIQKYLSFKREMEDFIFVKPSMYVDDLEIKIKQAFNKNKRVGMAFVTTNGKPSEQLQGIITSWDIIAASQH